MGLTPILESHHAQLLVDLDRVLTGHQRAVAANDSCFGVFFPGRRRFFGMEAQRNGGSLSGTPPQMTAYLRRPEDDIEELRAASLVEIFCTLFDTVGLAYALVDEPPCRVGGNFPQTLLFQPKEVIFQLTRAESNKVVATESLPAQRSRGAFLATRDAALVIFCHWGTTRLSILYRARGGYKTLITKADGLASALGGDTRP